MPMLICTLAGKSAVMGVLLELANVRNLALAQGLAVVPGKFKGVGPPIDLLPGTFQSLLPPGAFR